MHISPPSTSKVAGNGTSDSRSNWVGVARSIITLTERPQETAAAEGSVSNAADGSEPVVEQSAQDEFMDEKWLVPFDLNSTLLSLGNTNLKVILIHGFSIPPAHEL